MIQQEGLQGSSADKLGHVSCRRVLRHPMGSERGRLNLVKLKATRVHPFERLRRIEEGDHNHPALGIDVSH